MAPCSKNNFEVHSMFDEMEFDPPLEVRACEELHNENREKNAENHVNQRKATTNMQKGNQENLKVSFAIGLFLGVLVSAFNLIESSKYVFTPFDESCQHLNLSGGKKGLVSVSKDFSRRQCCSF